MAPLDVFPWHLAIMQPLVFTTIVMDSFQQWASKVGFGLEERSLPYTQLGMVRTSRLCKSVLNYAPQGASGKTTAGFTRGTPIAFNLLP